MRGGVSLPTLYPQEAGLQGVALPSGPFLQLEAHPRWMLPTWHTMGLEASPCSQGCGPGGEGVGLVLMEVGQEAVGKARRGEQWGKGGQDS